MSNKFRLVVDGVITPFDSFELANCADSATLEIDGDDMFFSSEYFDIINQHWRRKRFAVLIWYNSDVSIAVFSGWTAGVSE